jgi:hypothetical protein
MLSAFLYIFEADKNSTEIYDRLVSSLPFFEKAYSFGKNDHMYSFLLGSAARIVGDYSAAENLLRESYKTNVNYGVCMELAETYYCQSLSLKGKEKKKS